MASHCPPKWPLLTPKRAPQTAPPRSSAFSSVSPSVLRTVLVFRNVPSFPQRLAPPLPAPACISPGSGVWASRSRGGAEGGGGGTSAPGPPPLPPPEPYRKGVGCAQTQLLHGVQGAGQPGVGGPEGRGRTAAPRPHTRGHAHSSVVPRAPAPPTPPHSPLRYAPPTLSMSCPPAPPPRLPRPAPTHRGTAHSLEAGSGPAPQGSGGMRRWGTPWRDLTWSGGGCAAHPGSPGSLELRVSIYLPSCSQQNGAGAAGVSGLGPHRPSL